MGPLCLGADYFVPGKAGLKSPVSVIDGAD